MKSAFKSFQIFLLLCGVFGADEDEVKSVSVMEGDSVTLNPDPAKIKKFNLLEWRFGDPVIAQTVGNDITYPSHTEIFRDRLQLDQTGSLTIKNMRTKHSGLYKLQISHSTGTSLMKFNVTIYESPSVIAGAEAEMKSESVKEGDPVTLHVPQIQGDELIVWRFGDEEKLIAKADIETKSSSLYYEEERFRDRLQLNNQTGSLTITNTRTTDSGLYKVKISSNKQTLYKRFTVTVSAVPVPDSGLSGGAKAGIVIGVLLLAAAVAAGVMYYLRPRITNLPSQKWSVPPEDDVTLNPETEIQRGDEIQWLFGAEDTLIAEIKGENREKTTHEGADERFMNRLELDEKTGSLTINEILTKHTGLYTLKIRRGRETIYKRFNISVEERKKTVLEGKSVTLEPAYEIQTDDEIRWMFGDREQQTVLAELNGKTGEIFIYDDVADERFRDILDVDETTGSLIITNTRTEHSGVYRLQIISSSGVSEQTFIVSVSDKVEWKFLEEDSVTLKPGTKIQRDDQILWMFGDQDKLIAQMKGGTVDIYDDVNKRFRDRLKLDEKTGSLTITKIEAEHTGLYKLLTISSRGTLYKKFNVSIQLRNKTVTAGDPVHLQTGLNEIQTDDEIQWRFGDENSLIAEIKGGTGVTHDGPDERFRDRLELNKKTGDLTIKNSRDKHTGDYKLKIRRSERNTNRIYSVFITARDVEVTEGESVRLYADLNEIQTDDEIQWRFGKENSLIAEIKGGTGVTHDGPDERFRDRLELDEMTGDLIIKNSRTEHTGLYKL
uniref:Ig-like domain-containing protein n=1 Tax=Cyprinus carpio TaxID=7962 RepID=A0A8C1MH75_CYPCA